jgi:hypothetical protein
MCITCYGRLKAFEDYRNKCIKNQDKFAKAKEEIVEDPVEIEETYIEYIDEIEEGQYVESGQIYERSDSNGEDAEAVETIIDDINEDQSLDFEPAFKSIIIKPEDENQVDRSKGKEIYQRLLVQCELCQKMIEKNRMEGHINKHNNIRPYSCVECQKKFYCKQLLRLHRTSIHTNMRIKCETCEKSFPSQRALYAHSLRHKNRDKYECELCDVRKTIEVILEYLIISFLF